MGKRVRTLLRVSSRQQLHDDDIPLQRAEVHRYIATHKDWVFDKEYLERAISAYKNSAGDRDVLQEILEDAKKGEFEVLLSYMSDRIGRQEEYAFYVATLNRLGIEVWTINDGELKTQEHMDKLITYIKFWQNEGESKKTSQRVHDAQVESVRAGKFIGGKAPYGYRLVDSGMISNHGRMLKKLIIVEEHAEVVQKIYNLAIYQGYGYEKIAKYLNHEGIKAPTLVQWKSGTVASILKNPIYMGYYAINRRKTIYTQKKLDRKDWILSDQQIPELVIVSKLDWERAQMIRESRKNRIEDSKQKSIQAFETEYGMPFSTSGKLALIGLCYCGYCGKRLKNGSYLNRWTTKDKQQKVSFVGRYSCQKKCKERASYAQEYLESVVFAIVEEYLESLKDVDVSEEVKGIQSQFTTKVKQQLLCVQNERQRLKADMDILEDKLPDAIRGEYYFSAEKLSTMIKEKEKKWEELKEKENHLEKSFFQKQVLGKKLEETIFVIPDWRNEFQIADISTKKMLLSSLIDRIEVKDREIRIKFRICLEEILPKSI